jgi:hypothetical protein
MMKVPKVRKINQSHFLGVIKKINDIYDVRPKKPQDQIMSRAPKKDDQLKRGQVEEEGVAEVEEGVLAEDLGKK